MYQIKWTLEAEIFYKDLQSKAEKSYQNRQKKGIKKSSKNEGLLKQVRKTIKQLGENSRHPRLQTHPYTSIQNPYNPQDKVFEAYISE